MMCSEVLTNFKVFGIVVKHCVVFGIPFSIILKFSLIVRPKSRQTKEMNKTWLVNFLCLCPLCLAANIESGVLKLKLRRKWRTKLQKFMLIKLRYPDLLTAMISFMVNIVN